ncbi:MAG: radical SAM family heme chaperone HemW [Actinomycetes bacterium]
MAAQPPGGEPAPSDGRLPAASLGVRDFGIYVHVPFCATRCGYCDFNTYTAAELGSDGSTDSYLTAVRRELQLARNVLGHADRPISTVFFGGGTPTLLAAHELCGILNQMSDEFGIATDVEVTCEANPDSVSPESLAALRSAGFTRMSFGLQSTSQRALAVLERTHTPGRAVAAIEQARAAGFNHVNADVIYAIPGESDAELVETLQAVIDSGVDHVSAYSLIVEDGTRLASQVRRGDVIPTDDDVAADRYLLVDQALAGVGMDWYEVSNWSRDGGQCRHNMGYWRGADWWGIGPGAHSHVGGVRWWNVRHPSEYSTLLAAGKSPAQARELLTPEDQRVESILLQLRLSVGLDLSVLRAAGRAAAAAAVNDGLLDPGSLARGRAVLTLSGRLLADALVRDLID